MPTTAAARGRLIPPGDPALLAAAVELMKRHNISGLPVVAPTPERVAAMLAGRDPHGRRGRCLAACVSRAAGLYYPCIVPDGGE